jgi:glycosyltransferase involved in cell wall biosynthesis
VIEVEQTVPLVVPSPRQLRAPAVWITIANWADGLSARFGSAQILTAGGTVAVNDARSFGRSNPLTPSATRRTLGAAEITARTLFGDLRKAATALRFGAIDLPDIEGTAPFVWQHHDLFQFAGFRLARRRGVPTVLFVDAPQVWEAERWGVRRPVWGRMLERIGEVPQLRAADVVACVSDEVRDAVHALGALPESTLVTPCTAPPNVPGSDRTATRTRLGVDDAYVIGWVGSFRAFHGLDILVEACRSLSVSRRVVLLLVGDGTERLAIESRCHDLGVNAVFTGGVTQDEVFAHMAAFDCGVVTASPSATFHYSPLKLKEYLAAGVPVVAPSVGEMKRVLVHETTAMLYEVSDANGLARAMEKLAANPTLGASLSAAGRELSDRAFSIGRQVDQVIEQLAGRTRS